MQRHRHERVGFDEKFASGLTDPAAHHWRKIKPIAIFECVHQHPGNLVETTPRRERGYGGSAIASIDRMPGPGS